MLKPFFSLSLCLYCLFGMATVSQGVKLSMLAPGDFLDWTLCRAKLGLCHWVASLPQWRHDDHDITSSTANLLFPPTRKFSCLDSICWVTSTGSFRGSKEANWCRRWFPEHNKDKKFNVPLWCVTIPYIGWVSFRRAPAVSAIQAMVSLALFFQQHDLKRHFLIKSFGLHAIHSFSVPKNFSLCVRFRQLQKEQARDNNLMMWWPRTSVGQGPRNVITIWVAHWLLLYLALF